MAVPRNRTSNARKNSRRSHHAKVAKNLQTCSNCSNPRISHRICPHCGFYDGRLIINAKAQ
jgi:large subunit ribosomal protein L32